MLIVFLLVRVTVTAAFGVASASGITTEWLRISNKPGEIAKSNR